MEDNFNVANAMTAGGRNSPLHLFLPVIFTPTRLRQSRDRSRPVNWRPKFLSYHDTDRNYHSFVLVPTHGVILPGQQLKDGLYRGWGRCWRRTHWHRYPCDCLPATAAYELAVCYTFCYCPAACPVRIP